MCMEFDIISQWRKSGMTVQNIVDECDRLHAKNIPNDIDYAWIKARMLTHDFWKAIFEEERRGKKNGKKV